MESGRNEEPKLELDMNDVLSIAKETKSAGLRYVDEALAGKSYSQHEANLIKQQMEQSMNNILSSLVDNIKVTDADKADVHAALDYVEVIDTQLQKKVKKKEIELNRMIDKVVTDRAQKPKDWAGIMKEACQMQSKSTEQFNVNLPDTTEEEEQKDVDSSIENTAREYRDSVKLLADLNKNIPSKQNKIEKLQTLLEVLEITK